MTFSSSADTGKIFGLEVTGAEVMTIAMTAMLHFGGNFERSRLVSHELGLIKRLLSRSRLLRYINRLTDLIHLLFHQLGSVLRDLHWGFTLCLGFISGTGLRQYSDRPLPYHPR